MKKSNILKIPIKVQGYKLGSLFVMKHTGIKTRGWPNIGIKIFFLMVYKDHKEIVLEGISNSPCSVSAAQSSCPNNKFIIFTFLDIFLSWHWPSLTYKFGHLIANWSPSFLNSDPRTNILYIPALP